MIENVFKLFLLSFFLANEAKNPESTPPLKQNANGTSDLNLNERLLVTKESTFSRISLYFNLLLGLCLILKYFFFLIIRLKSNVKFVPGSMQNISLKYVSY